MFFILNFMFFVFFVFSVFGNTFFALGDPNFRMYDICFYLLFYLFSIVVFSFCAIFLTT